MNRARRSAVNNKPFVSGGVYDANAISQFTNPPPPTSNVLLTPQTQQVLNPKKNVPVNQPSPTIPTPVQNPVPEFVKKELVEEEMPETELVEGSSEGRKPFFKKIFGIRKKPSIRAKERKIRQNKRLRKILMPKNALMSLHEIKGIEIGEFAINNNAGGGFNCSVIVNNIQYEALGPSKNGAKNACCEKALRDLIIQRMMNQKIAKQQAAANKEQQKIEGGDQSQEAPVVEGDVGTKDEDMDTAEGDGESEEDSVPMLNLASFALHKLFCQWETEGFDVPEFQPRNSPNEGKHGSENGNDDGAPNIAPKKDAPPRTTLPENFENMHPATLLCMMRPGIVYNVIETIGQTPNIIQRVQVLVDGKEYIGTGRSKKAARKDAAILVCNDLFNTNFQNDVMVN